MIGMKVLWFTNIVMPCYAASLGLRKGCLGGWMIGLLSALRKYAPDLELAIVCQGEYPAKTIDNIEYRSISPLQGEIGNPSNRIELLNSMRQCIEMVKPDIIHFHGTENGLQNYYAELGLNIPCLTSIQGIVEALSNVADGGLDMKMMLRYRNPLRTILRRDSYESSLHTFSQRGKFEGAIYKRGGNFAGRTEFDHSWVIKKNPTSRYYYVGEVLRDNFYELPDKINRESFTVYAGAALRSPLKGGHWLIEAIGKLKRQYPYVCLRIAASNDFYKDNFKKVIFATRYVRYVRSLITKYGLWKNIIFLPQLDASQVREELLNASCYCLSSCGENSPNSLGEAMMMGTPVIATNVGGVPSMVDAQSGILIPPCNPDAMAAAIANVFEHRQDAVKRANNAYAKACVRFNKEVVVRDLIRAYNGVLIK